MPQIIIREIVDRDKVRAAKLEEMKMQQELENNKLNSETLKNLQGASEDGSPAQQLIEGNQQGNRGVLRP